MATLQTYDPFRNVWDLSDEVGRLFWGLGQRNQEEGSKSISFVPALDVSEDNEAMTISAELPGLQKEDVKIKVRDGVLTISGEKKFEEEKRKDNYYRIERSYGTFLRSFSLPTTFDQDNIKAEMKDGVLKLIVPKKPEAKEKEIKVQVH